MKVNVLMGMAIWMVLALFPDRAEEQERGYHRRPPRVRPRERTCLLFFFVRCNRLLFEYIQRSTLTCWLVDPLVVILGQM